METFSRDQISELRKVFALMDRGDRGKISMAEMKQLLNCQGYYPNKTELGEIIGEIDFDCDGEINFEDFVMYCSKQRSRCPAVVKDREIKFAFDFLDHNGDGYVSAADVRHVMYVIGQDVADEQVNRMLAEVDEDGSGRISYECFKIMMSKDAF